MSPAAMRRMIEDLQGRVERLEALHRAGRTSQEPQVDQTALNRAIRDLMRGNRKTLDRYLRRGGKIPHVEGASHEAESD
jgi:hypothetical protein